MKVGTCHAHRVGTCFSDLTASQTYLPKTQALGVCHPNFRSFRGWHLVFCDGSFTSLLLLEKELLEDGRQFVGTLSDRQRALGTPQWPLPGAWVGV